MPSRSALAFNGMVASPHALATAAGLEVLKAGGGAMDAAIATNAVLTVVYPDQTAIGGDCFIMYHEAASGRLHGMNGSGRAARTSDRGALRASGLTTLPAHGIHVVTVPGTIDAWEKALGRMGRFGLDRLLQPAIAYARDGFPISPRLAAAFAAAQPKIELHDETRAVFLPGGHPPRSGERFRQPELAASLELIARHGRQVFYEGEIADRIVATSRRLGGALALDDLALHHAEWVEPLRTDYRGVTVAELPPNSQALTALLELNLAELVAPPPAWGSADHLHPLIEAKKVAYAVRDATITDPDFAAIDTDLLISKDFAREQWRSYDPHRAATGAPIPAATGDTVYVGAVDRDGNAASLIQSLFHGFGSGVVAEGTGILLQSRGASFSLDDAHLNRLEGGKRPLHTLMPAMLLRDGKLLGPVGSQGGDAQAQIHLQLITNLVDHVMEPQETIDAPRWIAGGDEPTTVTLEDRFPEATIDDLANRGHAVHRTDRWARGVGHAQIILRDATTGLLSGGADPRADGLALGY